MRYFKTTLVSSKNTDSNKKLISKHIVGLLAVKEKCFDIVVENDNYLVLQGVDHQMAILFDTTYLDNLKDYCRKTTSDIVIYVFSLGDDDYSDEFTEFIDRVTCLAIPKALLNAFLRAQRIIGDAK